MDDRTIRKRIASMTTSRDLHYVLNVIKQNMAKEFGVEYYPFSNGPIIHNYSFN